MRGRFAPSPTGRLHLGNARTALLAWAQVRSVGGQFVLRVEDLDQGRVRPGVAEQQMDDLRWLGLDWDEGPDVNGPFAPYTQSERQADYDNALAELSSRGLVYACTCTRREIAAAASAPHGADDEGPCYPGTCRETRHPHPGAALRFRVEPEPVHFHDLLQGPQTFFPAREIGDFVVRRKDGTAAYQLAVMVDDAGMGITHVLRGADLLPSTARQILLFQALGLEPPAWTHVPLLLSPDGARLAKRDQAVTLAEARTAGVSPEAVVGWLAATCGLARPGEQLPATEIAARFDLARIPPRSTPALFAPEEFASR